MLKAIARTLYDEISYSPEQMRRNGWVHETFHVHKVRFIESEKMKLEQSNNECLDLIKRLRDKLVEQDEVIVKLATWSNAPGKKGLLC